MNSNEAPDLPQHAVTGEMNLLEHLAELRRRILYGVTAIAVGAVGAYFFSGQIFSVLNAPFTQAFPAGVLIGTGPAEAFMIRLKVSVFAGALLVSPVLFAQVWLFISPGLHQRERKLFLPFVLITTLLFVFGVWLCYSQVLPIAYRFFNAEYILTGITPNVKVSEHLSTMITALAGFGIVFEMPVLAFILGRVGILDHHTLLKYGRYAIVGIFIVAAVLTPPDVLSQFLMAGPLVALYGVSILVLRFTAKAKDKS